VTPPVLMSMHLLMHNIIYCVCYYKTNRNSEEYCLACVCVRVYVDVNRTRSATAVSSSQ